MARQQYKQYTDEEKRTYVLLVEAAGYPNQLGAIHTVSKKYGITYNTLAGWVKRGTKYGGPAQELDDELKEVARKSLSELIGDEVYSIFGEMGVKREDAQYRDLTVAAGILIDKLQLLNDRPTQSVKQAITFERRGITTLPEHLASSTDASVEGSEEI